MVRVLVAATPVQPYRFGLESVLQQRNDGGRWLNGGVEYFGEACGGAELWPALCAAPAPPITVTVTFNANGSLGPPLGDVGLIAVFHSDGGERHVRLDTDLGGGMDTYTDSGSHGATLEDVHNGDPIEVTFTDVDSGLTATAPVVWTPGDEDAVTLTLTISVPATEPVKEFTEGLGDLTGGNPFTIYSGFECKLFDLDEARRLVAARLAFGEPRAVEATLWAGDPDDTLGDLEPVLASPDVVLPGLAPTIKAAVAQLEQALGERYGGIGVIHAPRIVMPYAADHGLIVRDGSVLRTPLDTMWAFGAGYDPATGPTGETAPAAGQTWVYATGAIARWRSDVLVNPPGDQAFNSTSNLVTVLAERTVALTRDCVTIAVRAALG